MSPRSQLDTFRSTVNHEQHDSFLYYANFIPSLLERVKSALNLDTAEAILKHFGMYQPVGIGLTPPEGRIPPDFSGYFTDIEIPPNAFINQLGVLEIPGSAFHFTRYVSPLRNATTLSEVEKFPFPNVDGFSDSRMASEVDEAHSLGCVASAWVGHMYESAWQIRGYEEFLMDLYSSPEICEFILDRMCERNITIAVAAARAGVDVIATGDDVANQRALMFAPDIWRKFIKARWAKVYQAARQIKPDIQIWYHSDGNIEEIIPELIDIGVTILNPVQPECLDLIALKRNYGRYLVFDGAIGTQTTMPFGTPEEVRQVVRERKETLGRDGALILSPTHVLEPEVPVENIVAFFETSAESLSYVEDRA